MRSLFAGKWWLVLPVYLLGGLALGLADPRLGALAQQIAGKPGVATAISVNILLPALALVLGVAYPRLGTAWLGALLMTAAYTAGLAINYPPPAPVDAATLLASVKPVLVVACLGYAVLGTAAVVATWALKKSGLFGTHAAVVER